MEEKILQNKKNGMLVLCLTVLLILALIGGIVVGAVMGIDWISGVAAILLCLAKVSHKQSQLYNNSFAHQ